MVGPVSVLVALINGLLVLGGLVSIFKEGRFGLSLFMLAFGATAFFAIRGGRRVWTTAMLANLLLTAGSVSIMLFVDAEMRVLALAGIPFTLNMAFLVWRTPKKPRPQPQPQTQSPV